MTVQKSKIRAGCKDLWNAFMVKGAIFSENDIPFCPTTAKETPKKLTSFSRAKTMYNKHKKRGDIDFFEDACVHFYQDDQNFDGKRCGIWTEPSMTLEILCHFAGVITPDFSTCADFPDFCCSCVTCRCTCNAAKRHCGKRRSCAEKIKL